MKHPIMTMPAFWSCIPSFLRYSFDSGSMLNNAENSYATWISRGSDVWRECSRYHDAEAQAQRTCEEAIAVLDAKVPLPWKEADDYIDAND